MKTVLTPEEPFGPPQSEALIASSQVFLTLYMSENLPHQRAAKAKPSYIIGRRGAGKTSFLIGTSLVDEAKVMIVRSEDIYTEVDKIVREYNDNVGALVADLSCYIWEVIISHAAIIATVRSAKYAPKYDNLWKYLRSYGKEESIETDEFLAQVAREIRNSIFDDSIDTSFRKKCKSVTRDGVSFESAMQLLTELIEVGDLNVAVVVDNLEDLGGNIYRIEEPLKALLRFVARIKDSDDRVVLPFRCQFCFPSEVLPKLYEFSANPEKDLRDRLTIQWHARELLHLSANRLAYFLSANDCWCELSDEWSEYSTDDLPLTENKAMRLLRSLLPIQVENGFNVPEDPIAYILRHTQLVPRQMIVIFNSIFSDWGDNDYSRISAKQVLAGVAEAEDILSSSILTAYRGDFPHLADAIQRLRNNIMQTCKVSEMHENYNHSGGAKSGMDFDSFLEALLTVGAIGIRRKSTERYEIAEFAYTLREVLPPTSSDDYVCIHPLFIKKFHDHSSISSMKDGGHKPIYPYGADPSDGEYRQW